MNHHLIPEILTGKTRLQEIYDLRVIAYENSAQSDCINRKIYPNGWSDHLDELENTIHWIVIDNGKIIASARLAILKNLHETKEELGRFGLADNVPFAYWSRLVVHPDYRRTRTMMRLDAIRKSYIDNNNQIKFALSCVVDARAKSLLRLGFEFKGNVPYNWGGGSRLDKLNLFIYQSPMTPQNNITV